MVTPLKRCFVCDIAWITGGHSWTFDEEHVAEAVSQRRWPRPTTPPSESPLSVSEAADGRFHRTGLGRVRSANLESRSGM